MRKILTVLAILIFLFSCSSTKDVVLVEEDSVVEEIPTVYEEDEVVVPPPVDEAIPEVEQEPAVPEVVEIEDAEDEVAEPVITTEEVLPDVDATQQSPITIVEEISEKIVEPLIAETGEDNEDASFENEEEVLVTQDAEPVESAQEQKESAYPPLKSNLSDDILYIMVELIVIVFIFTVASMIRNKFQHPLPLFISILLSLLLTAMPIVASMVIKGWSNLHLLYLVLLISFGVFRSKERRY